MAVKKLAAEALRADFLRASTRDVGTTPEEITELASTLALEIGRERCRLQLFAPTKGEIVSNRRSQYVADENQGFEDEENGEVELIISPGLEKRGDGHGKFFAKPPVPLRPSKVFCSVRGQLA